MSDQSNQHLERRLPNALIAGVIKGGTTSLFRYLSAHPGVCGATVKETCYFHGAKYGVDLEDIREYAGHFKHCQGETIRLEATAGYFDGGYAVASAVHAVLGSSTKIIVVLRNPVDRVISFFHFAKAMLWIPRDMDFETFVDLCEEMPAQEKKLRKNSAFFALEVGKYDEFLVPWESFFGSSLRVCFFEDLKNNPKALVGELWSWMGLQTENVDNSIFSIENRTVGFKWELAQKGALWVNQRGESFWRRHARLKKWSRNLYYALNGRAVTDPVSVAMTTRLQEYYEPHIGNLGTLLRAKGHEEFPGWLR